MKSLVLLFCILCLTEQSIGQCSDAGVCSLRDRTDHQQSISQHTVGLHYRFGLGAKSDDIRYHTLILDAALDLQEIGKLFFSLPYHSSSGKSGSARGIGDLIISWEYGIWRSQNSALHFQMGVKTATGNANTNPSLPQLYQPGLGSNDALIGLVYRQDDFDFSLGYQASFGRNNNAFVRLQRGDDALLSAGYTYDWNDFRVHPVVLFIQRFGESSVKNSAYPLAGPEFVDVAGSDQHQINFQLNISHMISENVAGVTSFAFPFLHRPDNTDGLTRAVTLSAGILVSL